MGVSAKFRGGKEAGRCRIGPRPSSGKLCVLQARNCYNQIDVANYQAAGVGVSAQRVLNSTAFFLPQDTNTEHKLLLLQSEKSVRHDTDRKEWMDEVFSFLI
jgi:hypothetical protein